MLQNPNWVASQLRQGHQVPPYSYGRNNPVRFVDPTGLEAECPNGFWIGAPLVVADVSFGPVGGIGFAGVYSCTSAPVSVAMVSVCGLGSLPKDPKPPKVHAACGVGLGAAWDTPDLASFHGWGIGGFASGGAGANVTIFAEAHPGHNVDTAGVLVGPGAGFSFGPLVCRTWAWQI